MKSQAKSTEKSIEWLNKILNNELHAVYQYLLQASLHEKLGLAKLAEHFKQEALEEQQHTAQLIQRIIQLDHCPQLQLAYKLPSGQKTKESLTLNANIEQEAIAHLRAAISYFTTTEDFTTKQMLTQILKQEEEHLDWIEAQLSLIDQMGISNYLQTQV